jgi:hypothetical protein
MVYLDSQGSTRKRSMVKTEGSDLMKNTSGVGPESSTRAYSIPTPSSSVYKPTDVYLPNHDMHEAPVTETKFASIKGL